MSSYHFSNFEAIALCSVGAVVFGGLVSGCAGGVVELATRNSSAVGATVEIEEFRVCVAGEELRLLDGRPGAQNIADQLGVDAVCRLGNNWFEVVEPS